MSEDLKEYREHVKNLAECVLEQIAEGQDGYDALHEACDGSAYVIYRGKALQCLLFSENSGEEAWRDVYNQLPAENPFDVAAYFALRQDVAAEMERLK